MISRLEQRHATCTYPPVRRLSCIVLLAAAACSASRADTTAAADLGALDEGVAVALDDVAILFPLPEPGRASDLWPASRDLGDGRPLLPSSVVEQLGDIVAGDRNTTTYAKLQVVSLRLEPCFVSAGARPEQCERQIRFVLQPVSVDSRGALPTTTLDAASCFS